MAALRVPGCGLMVRDAASQLLTMRVWHFATCQDLILRV
jgi:hypothetical protein